MKILIIMGHPNIKSFNTQLADSYQEKAEEYGHSVQRINIADLAFDPILHKGYAQPQELEPDLQAAQKSIHWAEHIVLFSPMWWGGPNALLKGFIDRTILPGFGFKYHKNDPMWDKLLSGRTGHIVHTTDSPRLWATLVIRNSDIRILKHEVFQFCGIKPVKVTHINGVRSFDNKRFEQWIEKIKDTVPKK